MELNDNPRAEIMCSVCRKPTVSIRMVTGFAALCPVVVMCPVCAGLLGIIGPPDCRVEESKRAKEIRKIWEREHPVKEKTAQA